MDLEKNLKLSDYLSIYGKLLNTNQLEIMSEYYFADKTISEIAFNCKISRQGILDVIKRCEAKLISFEKKLGLHIKKNKLSTLLIEFEKGIINKKTFITKIKNYIGEI